MLYVVTYTRNGKTEQFTGSRSQCAALLSYLERTYRIVGRMDRAA